MSQYIDVPCPVCGQAFCEHDDVVVCPACGTPHHRSCYHDLGCCVFEGRHDEGYIWQPPAAKPQKTPEQEREAQPDKTGEPGAIVCPRCKANNPPYGIFCHSCGAPLTSRLDPTSGHRSAPPKESSFPSLMPQVFSSPYADLNPEDEIDGVTIREIAAYVGPNSRFFLPRFKRMSEQKSALSLNWSALVVNFVYFFYRKMVGLGIILLVLTILSAIPSGIMFTRLVELGADSETIAMVMLGDLSSLPDELYGLHNIQVYISYALLLARLVLSLLFNWLYQRRVIARIKQLKAETPQMSGAERLILLSKRGGISRTVLVVFAALFMLSYFLTVIVTLVANLY